MKITVKVRVFALVSILVVSSMLALSYFLLNDLGKKLEADFETRGSLIVNHFAADSTVGIIIEDVDNLARATDRLFKNRDIVYAGIYDAKGTRLAAKAIMPADEADISEVASRTSTIEIKQILTGKEDRVPMLDFFAPAKDENGESVGWVQIGLSLQSIDAEMRKMAARALVLVAIFVVVGSVASFLVANSIAKPIKTLTRVFAIIAGGDLDHEIDTSRQDELGSLSANFAVLRDSIRQKIRLLEAEALVRKQAEQELEQHRDNLEELVRGRTAELADTNAELKTEIAERQQIQEYLKESLDELARHNDAMTGREIRIVELKAEVNKLLEELGRDRAFGDAERESQDCGVLGGAERGQRAESSVVEAGVLAEMKNIQGLLESFCESVGIAAAIIDLQGEVLVGARWQKICTDFHRRNPQTCRRCVESDTVIANQLREGQRFSVYTCKNGLTDAASPIIVNRRHVANFFVGQFLLDPPDLDFFRKQAADYGFQPDEYFGALAEVPIVDRRKLEFILRFLSEFAVLQGSMGLAQSSAIQANADLRDNRKALLSMMEDLIEARKKAEDANQSKSEFLANMSHEIRTPMTAILGYADILLEDGAPTSAPPEHTEAAKTIRRNGEYLLQIINDILDLSKIEAGKMSVESISCSPCGIIAEVALLMRVRADAEGLRLNIEYSGAIPETAQTDPTRLRQILINLIGNAIKFTDSGSVSLISSFVADADSPFLQFDVVDTGIGMTQEQVAGLFQPFAQADTSTTRKFGGTGLGLTISKRFAKMLGGDIVVADSQEGVGTRFRATVSAGTLVEARMIKNPSSATALAREPSEVMAKTDESELADCRILLAEDGPDNQRLIAHFLKKAGARVKVVENGKLAVDAALAARDAGEPFDVILMDMQMPVMDGYEATGQLRRKGYTETIIALTAHAMASDRDKCIEAGCDDYAVKPINRRKLIEAVRGRLRPATPTAAAC